MPLPVCHQLPAAAGGHLRPSWPEKTPDVDHQPAAGPVCTVLSVRFCAAAAVQHLGWSTERRDFYRLRFSAGAGAIEAYIERVSRSSGFEYGKARMFGCLGWALCATTAGLLFNVDPSLVFWMGSGCALLLVLLVALARPGTSQTAMVMNALGANSPVISAGMVFSLFRMRQMWMFVLYMIGVACVYDVFDQQFATFFRAFFDTPQAGIRAFGFATTAGEICNAIIMFCSPG